MQGKTVDDVLATVEAFAKSENGVDGFKPESPVNACAADGSAAVWVVFDEIWPLAGCLWVMLSGGGLENRVYPCSGACICCRCVRFS